VITMWERAAPSWKVSAAVMEGVRNRGSGAEGAAAIAGPHDYEQIPALVERSVLAR